MAGKTGISVGVVVLAAVAVGGWVGWQQWQQQEGSNSFHTGNGRLEATQSHVASRIPGILAVVSVREGDHVAQGQPLAELDSRPLQAEIVRTDANIAQAQDQIRLAQAQLLQSETECAYARSQLARVQSLSRHQFVSVDQLDNARMRAESCDAVINAARASVAAAASAAKAAQAAKDRLQVDLDDSVIRAPFAGYVLYRLSEPGEMVAAGASLFTLVSDNDVYLTVFLPADIAGQVAVGEEARLVMDARPDQWVAARVSYVAPEAEFTPKAVETATERSKLVFRTRLNIDAAALQQDTWLKSGMPGVGWLRTDSGRSWPAVPR